MAGADASRSTQVQVPVEKGVKRLYFGEQP